MVDKEIKKIGISTGGGDCPGLNAVIRAATYTAINKFGWEVLGIMEIIPPVTFRGRVFLLLSRNIMTMAIMMKAPPILLTRLSNSVRCAL